MTVEYKINQMQADTISKTVKERNLAYLAIDDIDRSSHDKKEIHKIIKKFHKDLKLLNKDYYKIEEQKRLFSNEKQTLGEFILNPQVELGGV